MVFAGGALFGHLSALGNAEFGLLAGGEASHDARRKRSTPLRSSAHRIWPAAAHRALFAGEVQRVALARAVALDAGRAAARRTVERTSISRCGRSFSEALRKADRCDTRRDRPRRARTRRGAAFRRALCRIGRWRRSSNRARSTALRERPASGYVASFAGVNFYRGPARPLGDGSSLVHVGGGEVVVQGDYTGEISFTVDPDTVTLSAEVPHTSARNVFRGRRGGDRVRSWRVSA